MLDKDQYNLLVKNKVIHEGGFITLVGKNNEYRVVNINNDNYLTVEEVSGIYDSQGQPTDKRRLEVTPSDIATIDEMDIERLLQAYSVDEELSIIDVIVPTDIDNDVIGKEHAIIDDNEVIEGMKFMLYADKNPKYNQRVLTVRIENNVIKMVAPRGRPKKIK